MKISRLKGKRPSSTVCFLMCRPPDHDPRCHTPRSPQRLAAGGEAARRMMEPVPAPLAPGAALRSLLPTAQQRDGMGSQRCSRCFV